jgi:segregation and condensation protein B
MSGDEHQPEEPAAVAPQADADGAAAPDAGAAQEDAAAAEPSPSADTSAAATDAEAEVPVDPATDPASPADALVADLLAGAEAAGPVDDHAPLIETLDAEARAELPPSPPVDEEIVAPGVADLPPAELRAVIESLLFVASKPLAIARLAQCLPGAAPAYLEGFLSGLSERYEHERRGWELREIAGGWQLLTRRELYPWVRQLERRELPTRLSKSALETLAIVAYKQPLTRGAIEDIRGVQCGPVLRQLMDLKLVHVSGRDESALGRPLLYGTTDAFLSRFGLGKLDDLPRKHEFGVG